MVLAGVAGALACAVTLAAVASLVTANEHEAPLQPAVPSADGRWVLQVQRDPPCLWVLDAERRQPVQAIVPATRDGRVASAAVLRVAPRRRSFIVAPTGLPELWEISYDPHAEEIYDGFVHDYRFGEGVARPGFLGLRRITLPEPLAAFVLDEHEAEAWGLAAAPPRGSGEGHLINLDVRRRIGALPAAELAARLRVAPAPPGVAGPLRAPGPSGPCATTRAR